MSNYTTIVNAYNTLVLCPTMTVNGHAVKVNGKKTIRLLSDVELKLYPLSYLMNRRGAEQLLTAYKGNASVPREQRWTISPEQLNNLCKWLSVKGNSELVLAYMFKTYKDITLRYYILSAVQLFINKNITIARDKSGKVLDNQNAVLIMKK